MINFMLLKYLKSLIEGNIKHHRLCKAELICTQNCVVLRSGQALIKLGLKQNCIETKKIKMCI